MRTFFGSVFFFICLLVASLWVEGLGNEFRGAVITSFIVSWAIGLAPPLLIRFGMAKKLLSVAASLGISALFIFVNLVISTALGGHGGPALYFIAVASYQILRKEGKCDGAVVPVAVTPAVTASKPAVVAGRMEPPPLQKKENTPAMNDDAFFDEVAKEIQENRLVSGVWARAFAEAAGDENLAKAIYIKLRVGQMAWGALHQETPLQKKSKESGFGNWALAAIVLAVILTVIGLWIWIDGRSYEELEEKPDVKTEKLAPAPVVPSAAASQASVSSVDPRAQQIFTRAQSLAAAGSLEQARDLLSEVISTTTEESMKNNAMRVLGRINIHLLLSAKAIPEKKIYVVQPSDSLDKIARQNKTTVDLIRMMNKVENNAICPGGRLLIPSAPFVVQVDKSARTLDLAMNGKIFKRYSVGLGVNGKTPVGNFLTVVHQTNPDWTHPGGGIIKFGDPRNVLGTRWMSIQDATRPEIKGFGIHGTPLGDSIGTETGNGCIRMLNEDVEELYLLIPRGTEVIISE